MVIVACNWYWNWADLVITILGSLLGLFFAILASWGANKLIEISKIKKMVKLLINELTEAYQEKKSIIKKVEEGNNVDVKILNFPQLEMLEKTGKLVLLIEKAWYVNLILFYEEVVSINYWYKYKSDFYFNQILKDNANRDENEIMYNVICSEISTSIENAYEKISPILNEMNKI